jgi:hypothetical protein
VSENVVITEQREGNNQGYGGKDTRIHYSMLLIIRSGNVNGINLAKYRVITGLFRHDLETQ